jgi:hypothetical protein
MHWPAALLALGLWLPAAHAEEAETRVYNLFVDGKRAGEAVIAIRPHADGSIQVHCTTDVVVRVLLYTFRYQYRGVEVWKDGQLQGLNSTCNDDGKRYAVQVERSDDALRLTVNGRTRLAPGHAWLSSYWQLPPARLRDEPLTVIDADNGRIDRGRLQVVGERTLTIGGQSRRLAHYRLQGRAVIDLWYDGKDRLVRQEWLEEGHRTVLELARID